jgi:hypothetical protein
MPGKKISINFFRIFEKIYFPGFFQEVIEEKLGLISGLWFGSWFGDISDFQENLYLGPGCMVSGNGRMRIAHR